MAISQKVTTGESGDGTTTQAQMPSQASSAGTLAEIPGLPQLRYNFWCHWRKLTIVVTLLVIEFSLLPIALFYGLWFGTTLQHAVLFAIVTAFFGLVSGVEYAHRSWRLFRKDDKYRPIGGKRWYFDATHFTMCFMYTYMTAILVGASIPYEPLVRPLAMPVPLAFVQVGVQMLVTGAMSAAETLAPFAISSIPKAAIMRPFVYTLIEDVMAVDGGAGKQYREDLNARYQASARFRRIIAEQNWFWGVGSVLGGAATLAVIWTANQELAYGLGWGMPLVFALILTNCTVWWVRHGLRIEKEQWNLGAKAESHSNKV